MRVNHNTNILAMSEEELRQRGAEWMVSELERLAVELEHQIERAGLAGPVGYWED